MKRSQISRNVVYAAVGTIIIAVSFTLPWYRIRLHEEVDFDMYVLDLIRHAWGVKWSLWVGSAMPVIAAIILTATALLSVIQSLLKGRDKTYLWGILGILSILCILINALYIVVWYRNNFGQWVNITNPGVIVAFLGAVIMVLSYAGFRERIIKLIPRISLFT